MKDIWLFGIVVSLWFIVSEMGSFWEDDGAFKQALLSDHTDYKNRISTPSDLHT